MRISDWSSDVCSSDLRIGIGAGFVAQEPAGEFAVLEVERDRVVAREFHRARAALRVGAAVVFLPRDIGERGFGLRARGAESEQAGLAAGPVDEAQPLAIEADRGGRSEEHTSDLQSLMRISYAVFLWTH